MIIGIIYKYTSPSGKSYIGQTTNEEYRRRMWFGTGRYTGGRSKIDRARKKYGANETNIAKCCRGECKSIKNFKWKYKEE